MRSGSRGFTLIEAIAAAALLAIGIVACLDATRAMYRAADRSMLREDMERLAIRKYDEILALGAFTSGQTSGDFADIGERRFSWSATWSASGVQDLDVLRVDVNRVGVPTSDAYEVQGLYCHQGQSK